jgi:hypothetical protein
MKMIGMFTSDHEDEDNPNKVARINIPKLHINGRGSFSGMRKWNQIVNQIELRHALFAKREDPTFRARLPRSAFPEFKSELISWSDFCSKVQDRELGKYSAAMQVLGVFKDRTLDAVNLFREESCCSRVRMSTSSCRPAMQPRVRSGI